MGKHSIKNLSISSEINSISRLVDDSPLQRLSLSGIGFNASLLAIKYRLGNELNIGANIHEKSEKKNFGSDPASDVTSNNFLILNFFVFYFRSNSLQLLEDNGELVIHG